MRTARRGPATGRASPGVEPRAIRIHPSDRERRAARPERLAASLAESAGMRRLRPGRCMSRGIDFGDASTVAEVAAAAERLWPVAGAESWDAVGLVSGEPAAPVSRILLAVDAVAATVDEAVSTGADLLLTHHPLLLRGVTSVAADRYKGAVISRLIRANCALLAAHTNADVVDDGTSGVLAARLGLIELSPIESDAFGGGIGRVGELAQATILGRFASLVAGVLPPTAGGVRVSGDYEQPVRRVAVCGGAGGRVPGVGRCARRRRLHHGRPPPPPRPGVPRAGAARRRGRRSSTSPTGRASGSGSTPQPQHSATRSPRSRSR